MISTRVYSQRDLRWFWRKVNVSTFGKIGCTTTALTSLLFVAGYDLTPPQVAEKLRAVGGYAIIDKKPTDLILWAKIEKAFPKVKFVWRGKPYDNKAVKEYINKGIPVLVEVYFGSYKHWVLYIGDQKMIDPWTGRVEPTSKYQAIGYSLLGISK